MLLYDIMSVMMKNYVKKLYNLIPRYGWIMLICFLSFNMLTYYGARLFIMDAYKYDLTIALDKIIPLRTEWIIIYVLSYLQWAVGLILAARERKGLCYHVLGGEIIAKFFCLICFLLFPATIVRPEITGTAPWDYLTRIIYSIDTPDCLCPSLHCLESYVCFRAATLSEKMPRWYAWVMGIFTLLVFASTVLVKQHFVVDIFAGVAVGEIGLQIARFVLIKKGYYEK
ncbi:MAG: phosphatase PAP2 family protein [Clostridia bacterium]|nr:phosphatase PAP2 family protein [Clostridia bacterium]